jgi:hypothetical protein
MQHFKEGVRAILTLTFLMLVSISGVAQSFAVLSHDGIPTVFSGNEALIDAHDAAQDGDIITLSPGAFKSTNISKAITLRGAGMNLDGKGTMLTYNRVCNDALGNRYGMQIVVAPDAGKVVIEGLVIPEGGIYFVSGSEVDIVRCKTQATFVNHYNPIEKLRFIHCIVDFYFANGDDKKRPFLMGCAVSGDISRYDADHCVFKDEGSQIRISNSTISNSIAVGSNGGSDNVWLNSVVVTNYASDGSYENYFQTIKKEIESQSPTNKVLYSDAVVFKDGEDAALYELTDENASSWLCEDGTQVGLYGGEQPFTTKSNMLSIKTLKVADKTDPEGILKLEVEIE